MPGLTNFISVVRLSEKFPEDQVLRAVSSLNKQIVRDFGPIWGVTAVVDAVFDPQQVTPAKWVIALVDDLQHSGLAAFHGWTSGVPYAAVEMTPTWTISLSHECLEMLADPFGELRVAGDSPASNQGRVEFLLEVCDPCQSDEHAYDVDGVMMSDFYTPNYFDPVFSPGVRYSFKENSLPRPLHVPPGGYLTWRNPSDDCWYQYDYLTSQPIINVVNAPSGVLGRRTVDQMMRRRDKAFWKRRHAALPPGFKLFDDSFFNGNAERFQKLRQAIKMHDKRKKRKKG